MQCVECVSGCARDFFRSSWIRLFLQHHDVVTVDIEVSRAHNYHSREHFEGEFEWNVYFVCGKDNHTVESAVSNSFLFNCATHINIGSIVVLERRRHSVGSTAAATSMENSKSGSTLWYDCISSTRNIVLHSDHVIFKFYFIHHSIWRERAARTWCKRTITDILLPISLPIIVADAFNSVCVSTHKKSSDFFSHNYRLPSLVFIYASVWEEW